jgi:hypothetical protein
MKTRNSKLQNSELKSITSFIAVFTAALLINAQAFAKEKSTRFNAGTEAFAEIITTETDATMNLESWMLNNNNFYHAFELDAAVESYLKLESWMTDVKLFNTVLSLEEEMDNELKVEEWMLSEISFSLAFNLEIETEDTLDLQAWMVSDSLFNSKSPEQAKAEVLAMASKEKTEQVITIEYKDASTGYIFLFKLAELEEPKLEFEYWMFDRKLWIRK